MGQESSSLIDDSVPPKTLKSRNLDSVAKYILDGHAKKIVVMVGAGISTSAGIPDFRSPETGLYANLAKLNLPYAEAVFDISFFRNNPIPFYALAHELYPGKYRPTLSHSFIRLLSDKGLLLKLFTQNIDCLDRQAGVPEDKIIEAHGSFARQSCIECHTEFPDDLMRIAVQNQEVPNCRVPQCNGLVKPEIVFFGEQLPESFHMNRHLPASADLCIVMGTSLTVQPFASLPGFCEEGVPRILINLERVGGLGSRTDDILLLGDCDDGVRKLASALGWQKDLEALWAQTKPDLATVAVEEPLLRKSKDEALEDKIASLTKEVDESLKISHTYKDAVKQQLSKVYEAKLSSISSPPKSEIAKTEYASLPNSREESRIDSEKEYLKSEEREPDSSYPKNEDQGKADNSLSQNGDKEKAAEDTELSNASKSPL